MFALQIGVVVRSGHGFFPDILGLFGSIGPTSGLLCFGILAGSGDAFPQGLAFGRGEVFVRGSRAGPFITAAPVLPPAAGRGIQMDTVGAVLAARPVHGAAAVQRPVSLDMFHQQPGSSQALREGGQDVVVHGPSCGPSCSGIMLMDVLSGRPASHGGRLRGSRAQGLSLRQAPVRNTGSAGGHIRHHHGGGRPPCGRGDRRPAPAGHRGHGAPDG